MTLSSNQLSVISIMYILFFCTSVCVLIDCRVCESRHAVPYIQKVGNVRDSSGNFSNSQSDGFVMYFYLLYYSIKLVLCVKIQLFYF